MDNVTRNDWSERGYMQTDGGVGADARRDEQFVKLPNALILWQREQNFIYTLTCRVILFPD